MFFLPVFVDYFTADLTFCGVSETLDCVQPDHVVSSVDHLFAIRAGLPLVLFFLLRWWLILHSIKHFLGII
jgi:hypothetical protein